MRKKKSPPSFAPADPGFEAKVRDSFARQQFMAHLGAELVRVEPGLCEIALPVRPLLTQQHGYVHAGVTGAIADSACGYAAFSLTPPGYTVLTVEYKLNLLEPAMGEKLLARGAVHRAGRSLFTCRGEVFATKDGEETLCAVSLSTIIATPGKPDTPQNS